MVENDQPAPVSYGQIGLGINRKLNLLNSTKPISGTAFGQTSILSLAKNNTERVNNAINSYWPK
jgi:hypothetical protein